MSSKSSHALNWQDIPFPSCIIVHHQCPPSLPIYSSMGTYIPCRHTHKSWNGDHEPLCAPSPASPTSRPGSKPLNPSHVGLPFPVARTPHTGSHLTLLALLVSLPQISHLFTAAVSTAVLSSTLSLPLLLPRPH